MHKKARIIGLFYWLFNAVTTDSAHPLFPAVGIEFYQSINGIEYSLKNGRLNAFSIVKADGN
ncbi:MAG: hypothetical protein V4643_07895 [Bacteroidota bacterium]